MAFQTALFSFIGLIYFSVQSEDIFNYASIKTDWKTAQDSCIKDNRILVSDIPGHLPQLKPGDVIWTNSKLTWFEYPQGNFQYFVFGYSSSNSIGKNCICHVRIGHAIASGLRQCANTPTVMNWMDAQNICTSKGNLWDPLPIDKIKQYVHWIAENEFVWLPKYPGGKLVELNDSVSLCLSAERLENLSFTWRFENCANSHGYVCADDPDKFAPHMISLNAVRLNTMFEVIVGTSTTRDFTKDTNQDTKTKSTTLTTSRKTKKSRSPTTVIPSTITSSLISPSTDTTNTTQEKTTEPTPSSIKYSTATNTSTSAMHNVTFGESSRGSDDTKDSTTVIWFVIGGIGIVGFIVGTIGTVYGCRREDCRRLSRQSLKRFRNGQTIISMDPGSNAVAGQPLSSVGVQPDLTHMYIHAINDEYEEIKSDRTIEVNLISQSVEDNSVYYEIDPDDIIEREVTPIYWSPKVRVTHQFDGSLELRSMSQEPSYAIGRIAASSAPVEKPCVVDKKTTECRSRKE